MLAFFHTLMSNRRERVIKLISSDNQKFSVPLKVLHQSSVIMRMIENLAEGENTIKINDVNGAILEKVIIYLKHHVDSPPFSKDDDVDSWEVQFFNLDIQTIFGLMLASVSLNIYRLKQMACWDAANRIRGKSTEEMRRILNIKNDLTPEQEEANRRENDFLT